MIISVFTRTRIQLHDHSVSWPPVPVIDIVPLSPSFCCENGSGAFQAVFLCQQVRYILSSRWWWKDLAGRRGFTSCFLCASSMGSWWDHAPTHPTPADTPPPTPPSTLLAPTFCALASSMHSGWQFPLAPPLGGSVAKCFWWDTSPMNGKHPREAHFQPAPEGGCPASSSDSAHHRQLL